MAEVTNQVLKIEKADEFIQKACVSFEVEFTAKETDDNIPFGVFILLMEKDEEFEKYHLASNGVFSFSFSPFNISNNGNHICWMANKTIAPNGTKSTKLEFENDVVCQEHFCDHNKYRVYIFIMPEVLCGQAWTSEVCVNYN